MTERDLELLSAYLDSTLDGGERETLEARLALDAGLRGELEALRETKALLSALPQLRAPRSLMLTADQVRSAPPARRAALLAPWVSIASAAAAFVLVAAGILSLTSGTAARLPLQVAVLPTESPVPQIVIPTLVLSPEISLSATLIVEPALAIEAAVTMMPMGTQAPPEAARNDGFAPPTFTPTSRDAANAALESVPSGGFTVVQTPATAASSASVAAIAASGPAETPALDVLSDVANAAPFADTALPELAAGASIAPAEAISGANADLAPRTTMAMPPTSTALAFAATLPPSSGSTATPFVTPGDGQRASEESAPGQPDVQPFRDPTGVGLIVAGMLLLFVAVSTTLLRMRR